MSVARPKAICVAPAQAKTAMMTRPFWLRSRPAIVPAPPSGAKVWMQPGTMVSTLNSVRKYAENIEPVYPSLVLGGKGVMWNHLLAPECGNEGEHRLPYR